MNNLELLEKHRRKVAFVLAAIILLLIYLSIIIFELYLILTNRSLFSEMFSLWIGLALISPFLYIALSVVACRLMHRIYRPVRESILNLEHFTTNVNHEFKTSLSEIISSIELGDITNNQAKYNIYALGSAKRLNIILDSLMPLAEYTNGSYRKKTVDIIQVFEGIIAGFLDEIADRNITISKDFPNTLFMSIDIGPLTICFQNILANAIKYNSPGGEIQLTIGKDFFEIYDTGIGIDAENLEKIFERSFQERDYCEGLGVGLSLVKNISQTYGWKLDIESEKDIFTRIKFSF